MDKQKIQQLQESWDALLDAEGLGVIDVGGPYRGDDIKQIKGKHKRLDAMINDPDPSGRMINSPVTAKAVETRFANADDEQSDFDDGLWDDDEDADNAWDLMLLSLTGSPKEAEIADRRRSYPLGLDAEHKPSQPKIRRLSKAQKVANIRARQRGEPEPYPRNPYQSEAPEPKAYAIPKPQLYLHELGKPCAHTDGGTGVLAMVERPKPDYGSRRDDDGIRMSPVVDTDGYPSGRSPYQMSISRSGRHNSDITG
jgi:hypothetical protein